MPDVRQTRWHATLGRRACSASRGRLTIAVPTLVVMGEQDAMIPRDRADEIVAAVAGSTLEIILDCGHLPPIEKPAALADLLRRLISNVR